MKIHEGSIFIVHGNGFVSEREREERKVVVIILLRPCYFDMRTGDHWDL